MKNKPRLQKRYDEEVLPALMKEFSYENPMQAPRLQKIVLNACVRDAVADAKILNSFQEDISAIAGQRAVITRAKKSIANFKLREGMPIGVRVTLRRRHMYEFLDRLVNVALPRVRDFKGISEKAFDGRGNYSMGIIEHSIFPEIDPTHSDKSRGFNIAFATSAQTDDEARALLKHLGFPFRGKES